MGSRGETETFFCFHAWPSPDIGELVYIAKTSEFALGLRRRNSVTVSTQVEFRRSKGWKAGKLSVKTGAWKMSVVKFSEVSTDLEKKVTSKNFSSTDFLGIGSYPWHRGNSHAIVSNGGRDTKAAKKVSGVAWYAQCSMFFSIFPSK